MRIPIRYQFMLPLLAVSLGCLLAVGAFDSRLAARQTTTRIEKQLQGVVSVLAESSYPLTDPVLRQMGGLANAVFVLTDAEGRPLASGGSANLKGIGADSLTARSFEDVVLGPEIVIGADRYFHSSVWVPHRSRPAGEIVLHILFARDDYEAAWRAAMLPSVLVGLVAVIAVALVTHLVAGRVSRVLSRLGREVLRLAEGDFSDVRRPGWDDETRDLALAVNQTASRLKRYESELRQTEQLRTVSLLGAGLAHEMRNAATGCRLAVDLHAECCRGDQGDESLEVARRQLMLMENRLQQLLRLGQSASSPHQEPLGLSGLVSEMVALIRPAARHAGVDLRWSKPAHEVTLHASSELVGQAVMNLLLNALDAAAKNQVGAGDGRGRFVSVEIRQVGRESELVVADSGEGPDKHVTDSVFEPFVTSKPEGVGLGLAVVKRVVESYGGSVAWRRDSGVTQFSIRLPLDAAGGISA